ncbi:hypothetical protein COV42_02235 [Candidatus Campbellbacteria bacterium CG11_big_fil_rev_8_21_14_0_20_44_21]|uniref:Uncharacterized protein n=1 Tax=Candidatus Campbellbacteria bacterium CG22_combo_CG10-13_8_21_14_all_43_18 TaxID=1974530 RepID=A0A2H0DW44_9BACT|nr:MAG: hypothetical protein COW82_02235 [Candidatus Campbellbacteria bacterium CG22_combo_CG10-13_8_21_14_all_43_18]PIR24159.1 MAG: hypothetical protein COV42_02235 [Candidatus Campbellbacteria bacterium CG11_big_fil_rev_8_21_14_0_20_44_21]
MQNRERKIIKISVLVAAIVMVGGFALFQSRNLLQGPDIKVKRPSNGEILEESLLEVQGEARNISKISLNGRQIFVDEKGIFNEKVLLFPGYNKLSIEAADRFGRKIQKELLLVLKENEEMESGLPKANER